MKTFITCVIAASVLTARAHAQAPNTNAALRYWMAFAVMQDPPADKATSELLSRVAAGTSSWDEARLGKLLDDNREALDILQRGTTLPACEWGLEYDLVPDTPIAHLAKARALGQLNVVAGWRLASRGQWAQAVEVWLTGVRFSQHVAQGGSLISALSARQVLRPTLNAFASAAGQRSLDARRRAQIGAALRALPDDGFDWDGAMRLEEAMLVTIRRRQPNLKTEMPSTQMVNVQREQMRAERKKVLDAVTK